MIVTILTESFCPIKWLRNSNSHFGISSRIGPFDEDKVKEGIPTRKPKVARQAVQVTKEVSTGEQELAHLLIRALDQVQDRVHQKS